MKLLFNSEIMMIKLLVMKIKFNIDDNIYTFIIYRLNRIIYIENLI